MLEKLINRCPLLLVLVAFILAKIPVLHYPFYWDESWSYAPGVRLMYEHGPSLMPDAIDTAFSRGHPLLYYTSAALWMKIFGASHAAQHAFGLCISCLLLVSVYEIMQRLICRRAAIIALALVAGQIIFFVQSTLLLPEVMVAWLALLTLYFYASRRYVWTAVSCTALMLTKESGMTMEAAIGLHALWLLFSKDTPVKEKLQNLASIVVPAVAIGIFFIAQHKLNGWWLYPEHTGLIDASWSMFKGKMRFCIEIVFAQQYRYLVYGGLIVLSAGAAIYRRNINFALPALLGIALLVLGAEYYGFITRRVYMPFVFALMAFTFYRLMKEEEPAPQAARFIWVAVIFTGVYLSFTCINFFTNRYLFAMILVFLLLAAYCFDLLLRHTSRQLFYPVLALIVASSAWAFTHDTGIGDTDLGIYGAMRVQEEVVSYMEQHQLFHESISAFSPLERAHLTQRNTGFLHSPSVFNNVTFNVTPATQYIIIDNIEKDTVTDRNMLQANFDRILRIKDGDAWAEIYKRR